jgi:hypothetical protein
MIAEVGGMLKVSGSRMAMPLAPPSPRQDADDHAQRDAYHHVDEVGPAQDDAKTVQQIGNAFHRSSSS